MIRTVDRISYADHGSERFAPDPVLVRCGGCRCALPRTWERIGYCLLCARRRGLQSPEEADTMRRTRNFREKVKRAR